jgi:type I restriction enzyme, S subunit
LPVTDWRSSTWGDEITLNYGKAIRGYAERTEGYRVYGTNGPVGWHTEALTQGPGIIFGRKGAYRGVHFSKEPFYVIDTAYYVVPKSDLDMRWLYYAMIYHRLGEIDDGSPIPSTTRAAVYVKDFDVPEVTEQRAIATVLSALDDKIELNRRMNETLEGMAQAIFKDWFVDFGPVRRKLAGVTDPAAIMGGLAPARSPELAALFPDGFGDEGLPEGWEFSTLASIATVNDESWRASNHPDQVEYVDLSNTKWGVIESTATLDWADAPSRARRIARPLDTVIGTVRPGNGSYAYVSKTGYTVSTGFAVLRPTKPEFADALYVASTSEENIQRLANLADSHGGAYPAVNPDVVLATDFVFSNQKLISEFSALARPMRDKIELAKEENRTLAETRDCLLPKLMSGEVRVRDGEAAI